MIDAPTSSASCLLDDLECLKLPSSDHQSKATPFDITKDHQNSVALHIYIAIASLNKGLMWIFCAKGEGLQHLHTIFMVTPCGTSVNKVADT